MRKRLQQGGLIGLLAAALAYGVDSLHLLDGLEALSWDRRVKQLHHPGKYTDSIKLIRWDQKSLPMGQPAPRQTPLVWRLQNS